MIVVEKKPVPVYEAECPECKSIIQYRKSEVMTCHITCPICGISFWADTIIPVRYEEGLAAYKKQHDFYINQSSYKEGYWSERIIGIVPMDGDKEII